MKLSRMPRAKMVESSVMKKVHRDEDDLMAMKPASPKEQPSKSMDEMEPKKMAEGGKIEDEDQYPHVDPVSRIDTGFGKIIVREADGGMIDQDTHDCIASAVMARRKKMAEGGMVDLSENADEEPNLEDQLSYEALKKENYSESEGLDELDQPEDSNLMGDDREDESENKHDRISEMRRRMKSRQG